MSDAEESNRLPGFSNYGCHERMTIITAMWKKFSKEETGIG